MGDELDAIGETVAGQLDLDAIEEWHGHAMTCHEALTPADTFGADVHDDVTRALKDIPALVAEVRRLREERDAARYTPKAGAEAEELRAAVERLLHDPDGPDEEWIRHQLQLLLDDTDARDSLRWLGELDALVAAARDAVAAREAAPERSMPGATDGALARLQTAVGRFS